MKNGRRRRVILVFAAICAFGLLATGLGGTKRAISDGCFLVGATCLVVGLAKLVRETGFFFIPLFGFREFIALITRGRGKRGNLGEQYEEYRRAVGRDASYGFLLLFALAALAVSAVLALP